MRKNLLSGLTVAFSVFALIASAQAETIGNPPNTFVSGEPALASEVNENFDTVYDQVNKVGTEIHIDSVNHRVGIGTTAPTAKLTIMGEGDKVVNAIKDKHIRLLENPGNKGKGYTVKYGMLNAKGDKVLFSDGIKGFFSPKYYFNRKDCTFVAESVSLQINVVDWDFNSFPFADVELEIKSKYF